MNSELKICIVGTCQSGKTLLANLICQQTVFTEHYYPTKALRIQEASILVDMEHVCCQLWDCSGNTSYRKYWPVISKGADGVVFVVNPANLDPLVLDKFMKHFCEKNGLSTQQCLTVILTIDNGTPSHTSLNARLEGTLKEIPQIALHIGTTDLEEAYKSTLKSIRPFLKDCLDKKMQKT